MCSQKKSRLFDQKPEGIPEALLAAGTTIGTFVKSLSNPSAQSKTVRRLFVTNLPAEYEDMVGALPRL